MWRAHLGDRATPQALVDVITRKRVEAAYNLKRLIEKEFGLLDHRLTNLGNTKQKLDQLCRHVKRRDTQHVLYQTSEAFGTDDVGEALEKSQGVTRTALLMLLKQIFPSLSEDFQKLTPTPLGETTEDLKSYLDAIIKSGVSSNANREVIYVLGNTNVGKTSLVESFKHFIKEDEAKSCLTENDPKLLKTRVAELYKDLSLSSEMQREVTVEQKDKVNLVKFGEEKEAEEYVKETPKEGLEKCLFKIYDIGGHQEYINASQLFLLKNGIALICFDSGLLNSMEDTESKYYSQVGTYIDLLCQRQNQGLKIVLVATKVDHETDEEKNKLFSAVLQRAKGHISDLKLQDPIFLVDEILQTSSKEVTSQAMMELYRKVATMMASSKLPHPKKKHVPNIWYNWLEKLRSEAMCDIKNLPPIPESDQNSESLGTTRDEVSKLDALQLIASKPIQSEGLVLMTKDDSGVLRNQGPGPKERRNKVDQTEHPQEDSWPKRREEEKWVTDHRQKKAVDPIFPENLRPMLDFFYEMSEILWYKTKKDLDQIIITDPHNLINSLRTIICHDSASVWPEGDLYEPAKRRLLHKGILSYDDFLDIWQERNLGNHKNALTANATWRFLIELDIVVSLDEDDSLAFIPCLISDDLRKDFQESTATFARNEDAICFQYQFERGTSTVGIFNRVLSTFAKEYLEAGKGGGISKAFSQKIEKREVGMIAGVSGVATEQQDNMTLEFQLTEFEIPTLTGGKSLCHPVKRGIRIHLLGWNTERMPASAINMMKKIDEIFTADLGSVARHLVCPECQAAGRTTSVYGNEGVFCLNKNFQIDNQDNLHCSSDHQHVLKPRLGTSFGCSAHSSELRLHTLDEVIQLFQTIFSKISLLGESLSSNVDRSAERQRCSPWSNFG